MKTKGIVGFVVAIMMVILAACGGGSNTASNTNENGEQMYKFKLSTVTPPTHGWTVTAEKFNEELQRLSDGRMSVEVFPSSQLGTEADMVQQMELGTLDFSFLTNAYMSTRSESLNAWFMPFLFEDLEDASQARGSDLAQQMLTELESQGLVGLDFSFAGERHVLVTDKAIETPSDLSSKKLRIIGNPVMQDFWTGLNVSPTPMPLSEIYSSLQQGIIDGVDTDLDALVSSNLQEIAKELTLTKHMAFPSVVVMSKQIHDQLSPEDQEIVKEAMQIAVDWGVQDAIERENSNLEKLKQDGVNIVEEVDLEPFKEVQEEIFSKYSTNELIKNFIEAYND